MSFLAGAATLAEPSSSETDSSKPATWGSFDATVRPLLEKRCADCHAGSKRKGGFSMNTRESILTGGDSGKAVKVGKSSESLLIELITETDPDSRMPAKGDPLTPEQVEHLSKWIDQGLAWDPDFDFGRSANQAASTPGLKLQRPDISSYPGPNPIDVILEPYFAERESPVPAPVSDRTFIRRASLDLIGLLPTPEQIQQFENDARPAKRHFLVSHLLADRIAYADHWLTFWNDMLRNAYRGTGFIDNGRRQITRWLYGALHDNKPYDTFVYDLISPVEGSEGFSRGILWRGVVNASQRKEMQAAQNISQVFMATNLKCASCHDSFVNDWKLKDAYGLASVFAEEPLEINRCNKPTGETSDVHFIYPELGQVDPSVPMEERRQQLADLVTRPENGRLSRAIVNRLWAWFFGRGLIETVDNLDAPAWNPELLEFLAADFQDHGYDLKHLMRRITTSRAYQLPGVPVAETSAGPYRFRGPQVKHMTAEQFADAVSQLTDSWPEPTGDMLRRDGRQQGGQLTDVLEVSASSRLPGVPRPLPGQWIWSQPEAVDGVPEQTVYFRSISLVKRRFTKAYAVLTCDNAFTLFVNGKQAASGEHWKDPTAVDLTPFLQSGTNVFAVVAMNKVTDQERKQQLTAQAVSDPKSTAAQSSVDDAKTASPSPGVPEEFAEFDEFAEFKRFKGAGVFESIEEFREFKKFKTYQQLREERLIAEFKEFQKFKAEQEIARQPEPTSPAGLFFYAVAHDGDRPAWTLQSDGGWKASLETPGDTWMTPDFDDTKCRMHWGQPLI